MKLQSLIISLSSLFVLVIIGCSQQHDDNKLGTSGELPEHIKNLDSLAIYSLESPPTMEIKLERETRFGNTDEIIIGLVRHVAVDDRGRVYLGDSGWGYRGVHVFDSDGTFIKTMGGEGRGPGEILDVNNMGIINDELYLYDGDQKRINFYSLESLSIDRTQNMYTDNWNHIDSLHSSYLTGYHAREDGASLVSFADPLEFDNPDRNRFTYYYLANSDGKIVSEELLRLPFRKSLHSNLRGSTQVFTLEHTRKSLLAHTPGGDMVTAWTEDFLLKKYGPNGKYKGAIYYPFERQQIDENKILTKFDEVWENNPEGIRMYKRRIRDAELPEHWPALKSVLIDDESRIWVATIGEDQQNFDWWVLKESGELLARFKFPRGDDVIKIKDGYLYARVAEEGTDPVVRFNINMTPLNIGDEEIGE